jgi:hypothetical protein
VTQKVVQRVRERRLAYRRVFGIEADQPSPDGEAVLKHLHSFCFGHKAAMVYSPKSGQFDPLACAFAQGKQEVLRMILENLHLDERYIINLREERDDD